MKRVLLFIFIVFIGFYLAFIQINISDLYDKDMNCTGVYATKLNKGITDSNCIYEFESGGYHIDDCGIYQDKEGKFLVDNVRQVGIIEDCNITLNKDKFTYYAYYINTILNEHRCIHSKIGLYLFPYN